MTVGVQGVQTCAETRANSLANECTNRKHYVENLRESREAGHIPRESISRMFAA